MNEFLYKMTGETALMAAAVGGGGSTDALELLLWAGADWRRVDDEGRTAAVYLLRSGQNCHEIREVIPDSLDRSEFVHDLWSEQVRGGLRDRRGD